MTDITQTGVCIEIRPKQWLRIDGIPSDLTAKEAEKLKRFITGWQSLMEDAQKIEEQQPSNNTDNTSLLRKFRRLLDYLNTLPAWRVAKAYICYHQAPMGNKRPEYSIEVSFFKHDSNNSKLPIGERFERISMKWLGTVNSFKEIVK